MGRRREEKVDEEYLAQLLGSETGSEEKIRVKMPNVKVNEMFALAEAILGGRRVTVLCADGETRMARIPGKMRRRQWVREGDLLIVWPWDFQDSKADVKHRYNKTQALYLSRKGVLPADVDVFGLNFGADDDDDEDDGLFSNVQDSAALAEEKEAEGEEEKEEGLFVPFVSCIFTGCLFLYSCSARLSRGGRGRARPRRPAPSAPRSAARSAPASASATAQYLAAPVCVQGGCFVRLSIIGY